jgi:hypothetical protein
MWRSLSSIRAASHLARPPLLSFSLAPPSSPLLSTSPPKTLHDLCRARQWPAAIQRLERPKDDLAAEVRYIDPYGQRTFNLACCTGAPLELLSLMVKRAERRDRGLCAIPVAGLVYPLHSAVIHNAPLGTIKFLIRQHPRALLLECMRFGRANVDILTLCEKCGGSTELSALLRESHSAVLLKDWPRLANLVTNDVQELEELCAEHSED